MSRQTQIAMILLVVCLTACTRNGGKREVPADSCTYEHTGNTHQYAIPQCVGYDTKTGACNNTIYIPQTEYEYKVSCNFTEYRQ